MKHSLSVQIQEVEREIRKRREVYPRLVTAKKMRQGEADYHIEVMETLLATLRWQTRCGGRSKIDAKK